jgi:U4/U6.U5 tri-snRNP-associated protein 1
VTMEEHAAEVSQNKNDEDDDEEVEQDDSGGFDAPIGRGMSNVLSMLRHTGEIIGKKAGKEEFRGRAKDKRTYEDYEALDLKKVVKIDRSNPGINEKDLEFANREIKLEYRDEHGRLLTRHEAFRQMSYQFHGHGSSKKNEERRMRQIEREHAEGTLASRMDGSGRNGEGNGTLGALKATQRATGKAFVVHKT